MQWYKDGIQWYKNQFFNIIAVCAQVAVFMKVNGDEYRALETKLLTMDQKIDRWVVCLKCTSWTRGRKMGEWQYASQLAWGQSSCIYDGVRPIQPPMCFLISSTMHTP